MRAAIYARVSKKDGQEAENQLAILREYCIAQGWAFTEYVDRITGSRADRTQFLQLFEDARQRKVDIVLFWALDRFTREGCLKTLNYLETLSGYGVAWRSHTEQYLDSAGIFKDAVVAIIATLAKQERVRIVERTLAGLERSKEEHRRQGKEWKKGGRPRKILDREKVRAVYSETQSLRETAARFRISPETARKIVRA